MRPVTATRSGAVRRHVFIVFLVQALLCRIAVGRADSPFVVADGKPFLVIGMYDYPIGGLPCLHCPLNVFSDHVDAVMQIVDEDRKEPFIPAKPLLIVLQGRGWYMCEVDRPELYQRCPNRIETRLVAYSSIIHGAKGVPW